MIFHKKVKIFAQLLAALLCYAGSAVSAQDSYPNKHVRIIVGFAPGGTNDILARIVAGKLQERFGQSVIVENKPGANSAIGTEYVAKAKPDGYTLLVSSSGGLTVNPVVMPKLGYDPAKDFAPIALLGTFPLVVGVNPAIPVTNVAGLIEYAKSAKDGSLNHGVASSSFQLAAELFASSSGIKLNHISYRGSGPAAVALASGEIQMAILDSAAVMGQVKAGKVKALAVTTGKRAGALPGLPTVSESGIPGYDVTIWTALMAPKDTPENILVKLRAVLKDVLADKDVIARLAALGMDAGNTDSAALSKLISTDIAKWTAVAANSTVKVD